MTDVGASERHEAAPSPDDTRKPDSPAQITKPSWAYVLRKTAREFTLDQCIDSAASLTYFGILSLFPALLAIFSLLGVLGGRKQATAAVLQLVAQVAPGSTASVVRGPIEQFANSPAAGFALVSGIVLAIWTASGYVGAFSRAMNRIYDLDEGRPYWIRKPQQLLITLVVIVLVLVIALLLTISGSLTTALGHTLGVGPTTTVLWSILKWPVLAAADAVCPPDEQSPAVEPTPGLPEGLPVEIWRAPDEVEEGFAIAREIQAQVLAVLRSIRARTGVATLFVSHDSAEHD